MAGKMASPGRPPFATRKVPSRSPERESRQRMDGAKHGEYESGQDRYAWAERAKTAGYPERFAQLALGHNSQAVHRAYAKNAQVTLPPLEDYERNATATIIPLPLHAAG